MSNPQLDQYIKIKLGEGVFEQKIRSDLLSAGWQENDINESFAIIKGQSSQQSSSIAQGNYQYQQSQAPVKNNKIVKIIIIVIAVIIVINLLGAALYYFAYAKFIKNIFGGILGNKSIPTAQITIPTIPVTPQTITNKIEKTSEQLFEEEKGIVFSDDMGINLEFKPILDSVFGDAKLISFYKPEKPIIYIAETDYFVLRKTDAKNLNVISDKLKSNGHTIRSIKTSGYNTIATTKNSIKYKLYYSVGSQKININIEK